MSTLKTCPGDCCASVHLAPTLEEIIEQLVTTTPASTNVDLLQAEKVVRLFWPSGEPGRYVCSAYDREKRACSRYEDRPDVCSRYPNYDRDGVCEYCTFDLRFPTVPGVRYGRLSETGIECVDGQPA